MPSDFFATLSPGERIVVRYRRGAGGDAPGEAVSGEAVPGAQSPGEQGPSDAVPAPGGERFSDALGDFVGLEPSGAHDGVLVVVRTRTGEARIPRSAVERAKRVPPAPTRRRPRAGSDPAPDA